MMTFPLPGNPPVPFIIAGPCAAESRRQVLAVAKALASEEGVGLLRAGVWKPRTQPGGFVGVGAEALPWLVEAREQFGLRPCVEVGTPHHLRQVREAGIDAIWIGARTTSSPFAVQELADELARGPAMTVLVKNPLGADLDLWEGALRRLSGQGVEDLAAVHRGFSLPVATAVRNRPIWRIPLELKQRWPGLPVLCDPSHMAGRRGLVEEMAEVALDLGLDGLMIEVHDQPEDALTDSLQQLRPEQFHALCQRLADRDQRPEQPASSADMDRLRRGLEAQDEQLLAALSARWKLVRRMAAAKVACGAAAFQRGRMDLVQERWRTSAKELGLPPDLVNELYLMLHEASLLEQMNLMAKEQ